MVTAWLRKYSVEVAWGCFALANWTAMVFWPSWETIPFHFVWISLTLVYGFRVWRGTVTVAVLFAVIVLTGASIAVDAAHGDQLWGELFEVPLMSAMFVAMVWHAKRREVALVEREAALVEVERAAQGQLEFVRDASHQLKTPIAAGRAIVALLHRDSHRLESDIADLAEELERLGRIAENLLVLASVQPHDLVTESVDVEDLVTSTVARWSRRAERRWWVGDVVDGSIRGDRQRLEDALDAVIENAVRATRRDDLVEVAARREGRMLLLEVADFGCGMERAGVERAFDRFWSAPYPGAERRGSGLGLSIVKAVAEAHGGWASLTSHRGRGTTVRIALPALTMSSPAPVAPAPVPAVS